MVKVFVHAELDKEKSISDRRTGHVLAIVNEAMANAVRHAQAESVYIQGK